MKQNKAEKIRTLLAQGIEDKQVAAETGTTIQYVYDIKSRAKIKAEKLSCNFVKRGPGRPRKHPVAVKPSTKTPAHIGTAEQWKNKAEFFERSCHALKAEINLLDAHIKDLGAVIVYLERKAARASNAAAV